MGIAAGTFLAGTLAGIGGYQLASTVLFGLAVLLIATGVFLGAAIRYKYDSQCPNCRARYEMTESEDPVMRPCR